MKNTLPLIVITGPTASNKTDFAIKLAKKINAEIICADSRIVYKGFDIVSAKPNHNEMQGVTHHLIDIIDPNEDFSAGDFVDLAQIKIEEITSRNKRVIIQGGTWFYIKALLGNKKLPKIKSNPKLREELQKLEAHTLWEQLSKLDPKRAFEIDKNNKDKIIRSIEMCKMLNSPISEYEREENNYNSIWYYSDIERELLYERINKRVDIMLDMGLYDEFQTNIKKWGKNNKIINNTIGYQEFLEYEDINLAVEKIKQHTRNFAKRQLSYFRNDSNIKPLNFLDEKSLQCIE